MDARAVETRAQALLQGKFPEGCAGWEIGEAVQYLVDQLPRAQPAAAVLGVRSAADTLNKHRQFEHTRLLGEAWRNCFAIDASVQRHLAQAVIELNALDAAQVLLDDGIRTLRAGPRDLLANKEEPEMEGLLARIAKQRFVQGDLARLDEAIARYHDTYQRRLDHPYWHGINVVALLARRRREGGSDALGNGSTATGLAAELRSRLEPAWATDTSPYKYWLAATLSEACVALGDCERAELWLYRFLHHPEVTPFAVDSYQRQLREIWEARPLEAGVSPSCASRLSAIVTAHLLRTQSRMTVSSGFVREVAPRLAQDPQYLEKNFSGELGISLDLLKRMLQSCGSIGCVCNQRGERLGTGFLVEGDKLKTGWGPAPVFVTNAHVISTEVPNAIAPQNVRVSFEVELAAEGSSPLEHRVVELLYTSPPGELGQPSPQHEHLDVTVVRLTNLETTLRGLSCARRLPLVNPKTKAYVVGHPQGAGLQVSLHDSVLLDIDDDDRLVHYRTPTDPGSSGSPVFNADWDLIALHHGGSAATPRLHGDGVYEANEGIAIEAIRRKL